MKRILLYFSSFELFILFQQKLRVYFINRYYILFRKRLNNKLKRISTGLDTTVFVSKISAILQLPSNLICSSIEKEKILERAKYHVNGWHDLLGSGDVKLDPIDWHSDFKSGYTWTPGTFYLRYNQENAGSGSDVKIPRELSRSHHLVKIALAYRITGDESLSEFCIDQVLDWIDKNPLMFSINWGCTMDVAIRAVNWIWVLGLLEGAPSLDNKKLSKVRDSLYQHGWFIYRNPENNSAYNGNHYLSDLAGQVCLGILFNDLKEPKKWLQEGKTELFREIRIQILPTGISYERSTNYNRLVLELILTSVLTLKKSNIEIPLDINFRLRQMFSFLLYSLKPDGNSPIIGDKDNGRLLDLGVEDTNDFRYLLSLGAILYQDTILKHAAGSFNIYCTVLLGNDAYDQWKGIQDIEGTLESKAFPDAGLYIMRKDKDYLMFNSTGKGKYPESGPASHTHSDLFSFELYTQGKSFLVDPGTFLYTADKESRYLFRSTAMHNTLTIDGESQNEIKKEMLWDFKRDAIPVVHKWVSDPGKDYIVAEHNGYHRLKCPVSHVRSIVFDKVKKDWKITDSLIGEGKHQVKWFFHFDTGIDFIISNNTARTLCDDGNNIEIIFEKMPGLVLNKEESFISKSYGIKDRAKMLVASLEREVPIKLNIEIKKLN